MKKIEFTTKQRFILSITENGYGKKTLTITIIG